jgi:hypothetical protein
VNNGGVELGLRAKLRQVNAVIEPVGNVYTVPNGPQTNPVFTPNRAAWNYEFSIDLQPGGAGSGLTLNDITAELVITNVQQAQSATVNPLTWWTDDSYWGPSGKTSVASGLNWGAQNSESPTFGDFPLAAFYNMSSTDDYQFTLNVYRGGTATPTALIASDTILVDVVATPLPSAAGMGALLVVGLGAAALLRKRMAVA